MQDIVVDETLWASSMLPEGILERWLIPTGTRVLAGDAIAQIRIEDALHTIVAPVSGRLVAMTASNTLVEPGSVVARLEVSDAP